MTALSGNRTVQLDRSFSLLDDLGRLTDNLIQLLGRVYRFWASVIIVRGCFLRVRGSHELSCDYVSVLLDHVVLLSWGTWEHSGFQFSELEVCEGFQGVALLKAVGKAEFGNNRS